MRAAFALMLYAVGRNPRLRSGDGDGMPRFFFDTDDGEHVTKDKDGIILSDGERARTEAMMLMRDLIYGVPPIGKTILGCIIRGEDGLPIHRLMMTVEGEVPLSLERRMAS